MSISFRMYQEGETLSCAQCGREKVVRGDNHPGWTFWKGKDFCCDAHETLYRQQLGDGGGSSGGGSVAGSVLGGAGSVLGGAGSLLGGLGSMMGSTLAETGSYMKETLKEDFAQMKADSKNYKEELEFIRNLQIPSDEAGLKECMTMLISKYTPIKSFWSNDNNPNVQKKNQALEPKIREAYLKLKLLLPADSETLQSFTSTITGLKIDVGAKSTSDKNVKADSDKNVEADKVKEQCAEVENMVFESAATDIQTQLDKLLTMALGVPSGFFRIFRSREQKKLIKAIKAKAEVGIMRLKSLGDKQAAKFFQKKFKKLK